MKPRTAPPLSQRTLSEMEAGRLRVMLAQQDEAFHVQFRALHAWMEARPTRYYIRRLVRTDHQTVQLKVDLGMSPIPGIEDSSLDFEEPIESFPSEHLRAMLMLVTG